jgi:imidazolonepropionase
MEKADLFIFGKNIITCKGFGKPKTLGEMSDVGRLGDAGIAVKDGIIVKVGAQKEIRSKFFLARGGREINAANLAVLPGLIDSHTHPVFAGNRVREFIMRAQGATYQDIHNAGGGIQFTVDESRKASFDTLIHNARETIIRMLEHGTTTLEAKSGYGLDTDEELRQMRVIHDLIGVLPVDVIPTFLGAHSIPREYADRRQDYVNLVIKEMLPKVKEGELASFVDVFCEEGAFTLDETRQILEAAKEMGFGLKLHAEEFSNSGSAVMAGKMGAVSVDHLLRLTDQDIEELAKTDTILTLMPGTLFFLGYNEFAPARKIIDGAAKMALATDFNAGSCMSASMQMAMSLGCIKMKMTPEEVINAATYNAAFALGMESKVGSIEEGKYADVVIMDLDDYRLIPYHFGENLVRTVIKFGRVVVER